MNMGKITEMTDWVQPFDHKEDFCAPPPSLHHLNHEYQTILSQIQEAEVSPSWCHPNIELPLSTTTGV